MPAESISAAASAPALLTVVVPPTIITEPDSFQIIVAGNDVMFYVEADGTAPFSYQWRFNGAPVAGATDSSYTITNAPAGAGGTYSVVVSNPAGSATSADAVLIVMAPPVITSQPADRTVILGQIANFTVTAAGTAPLKYQWQFNGTNLAGATKSGYTIANAQTNHAGNYTVVVANSLGTQEVGATLTSAGHTEIGVVMPSVRTHCSSALSPASAIRPPLQNLIRFS